jgi:hypothetical protein
MQSELNAVDSWARSEAVLKFNTEFSRVNEQIGTVRVPASLRYDISNINIILPFITSYLKFN